MRSPALLLLAALLGALLGASAQRLTSRADVAALYSLRASLGLRARDWPRRADPCAAWTGVGCVAGRVTSLDISGLRRTRLGRLRPRFALDGLSNLTRLASFNASGFALPGRIPDSFGPALPASVSVLDLRRASVLGPIPASLGAAAGLSALYLSGNNISGAIPSSLGRLRSLTVLDLARNSLTGPVPDSLGALSNLTALDLSSNSFSGVVPPALGTLSKLKTFNLSNNQLAAPVPPQLGDLSALLSLDLSSNSLQGSLPDDLKNLRSIQQLDLSNNLLSGSLSSSLFSGLTRLQAISFSHNNFSGWLPDTFWALPQLGFIDLSHNNLTGTLPDLLPANASASSNYSTLALNLSSNLLYGSIPSRFRVFFERFSTIDLSENYFEGTVPVDGRSKNVSFNANCFQNASHQRIQADCQRFYSERGLEYDVPAAPTPSPLPPPSSSGKKSGWSLKYILIGVFGGIAFLLLVVIVMWLCLMRCGARAAERREVSSQTVPPAGGAPPSRVSVNISAVGDSFTYEQLLRATSEFSESNLIKHGHSGDLYHGVLEGGLPVVVKRIDLHVVKREAYLVELNLFAATSHSRLVPFLGHYLGNENEKFLVYKYMPNGDLSNALYQKPTQGGEELQSLDWIKRLKIATGVAEALSFLHHECNPPFVHRGVQAGSILLDDKFEVRLGSLSEVCTQEGDGHQNVITRILRLPQTSEQGATGLPSATCSYDVYCMGKVLLELVTGKIGISGSSEASTNEWLDHTLSYINIYDKELVTKIVDPSLIVDEDFLEEVWAMAIVAKSCLNPKPSKRPPMKYILKALENPLKVVRDENISSSARLRATSSRGSWNAAFFGSWRRSSSDIATTSRDERILKRSGTMRSQESNGEHSFSHKRPSKEIFPEPSDIRDIED